MAFQSDYRTIDNVQTILDAMTFLVDAKNQNTDQSFKFYADDPSGPLILQARYDETTTTAELTSSAVNTTLGTSGNPWDILYATTGTFAGSIACVNVVASGYYRGGSSTDAVAAGDWSTTDGSYDFFVDASTGTLSITGDGAGNKSPRFGMDTGVATYTGEIEVNHNSARTFAITTSGIDILASSQQVFASVTLGSGATLLIDLATNLNKPVYCRGYLQVGGVGGAARGDGYFTDAVRALTYDASQNKLTTSGATMQFGTTTNNTLTFYTNNTARWRILNSGAFQATTDNTYNIGASGSNRPATVYIGTALNVGNGITPSTANGDYVFGDGTRALVWDASAGVAAVIGSVGGAAIGFNVGNTSNTANSRARHILRTGGSSAGDPFTIYGITGVRDWSIGCDNSDGDKFKIDLTGTLGGSEVFTITTTGTTTISQELNVGTVTTAATQGSFAAGLTGGHELSWDSGGAALSTIGTSSGINNPKHYLVGSTDAHPIVAIQGFAHDNAWIYFDAYYTGSLLSSDADSNFGIRKQSNQLKFLYNAGTAQGAALSWSTAMYVTNGGGVNVGTTTAAVIQGDAAFGSTGTYWFLDESADQITFQTDSAGALGPVYRFYHNSASPAASDVYARLQFDGESSTGATVNYSRFDMVIDDATNGSEDAHWSVYLMVGGALGECFRVGGNTVSLGGISGSYVQYNKATDTLLFEGDPAGATGITWRTYTNSATPAPADFVFTAQHDGENATGGTVTYGEYRVQISNPALGVEDSLWQFDTLSGGVTTTASLSVIGVWTDASLDSNKVYETNWTWGTEAEDTATAREIIRQLQNGVFTGTGSTSCHYIGPTAQHWHKLTGLDDGLGIAPKNLAGLALMAAVELDTRVEDIGLQLSLHAGRLDAAEQKILALEARVDELEGGP